MSLDWNLAEIADADTVCWTTASNPYTGKPEVVLHPRTETIIWACMSIGLGRITTENALDFYARVSLFERLFGVSRRVFVDGKHIVAPITLDDIRAHIGLRTNVSNETHAKWSKRIVALYIDDTTRRAERARKENNG